VRVLGLLVMERCRSLVAAWQGSERPDVGHDVRGLDRHVVRYGDEPWWPERRGIHREGVAWGIERREVDPQRRMGEPRGSAINYPGNPRFHQRVAFKMTATSEEMEQRRQMLSNHAVVITDKGPMRVQTREEVNDIILHQFGIRKHECYVYRSYPKPFVAMFHGSHDRDVVFDGEKVMDDPIELRFHEWGLDWFGDREVIPYHVHLNIEGIS
jgi:hypothetical protein